MLFIMLQIDSARSDEEVHRGQKLFDWLRAWARDEKCDDFSTPACSVSACIAFICEIA
jgi:hypothetical protein